MARKQPAKTLIIPCPKGASLKQRYALARKAFTAADLQRYTVSEVGIPARQVLAELEALNEKAAAKKRKANQPNERRKR